MGEVVPSRIGAVILLVFQIGGLSVSAADVDGRDQAVVRRAMTLLKENCVSCHNTEKKKGKLVLSTREGAMRGGENGAALVSRDAGSSRLAQALLPDADPHMPPKGQLTPDEIKAIKAWIDAGAAWDETALAKSSSPAATRPIELRALPKTYQPVLAMALSPDQKRLAVGRGDRIRVFDVSGAAKALKVELATPNDLVQSLAWSGDGKWLASGGFRSVRLWDGESSQPIRTMSGLNGRVTALAFAADGNTLVAGEGEVATPGTIRVWQVPSGEARGSWVAHADSILSLKLSGDGKLLATAGADNLAKVWDVATRKEVAKLEGHAGPVMAVALSADGARLASAGADKEIKFWDVKTREQTAALTTNPDAVTDLSWVDDKTVLSACEDGVARFSTAESKERATRTFNGAPDVLYCAVVTRDGKTLYGGCHDGHVYVWSAADGKLLGTLPIAAASTPAK